MMNRIASERYQQGLKNERMIDIYQDNLDEVLKSKRVIKMIDGFKKHQTQR